MTAGRLLIITFALFITGCNVAEQSSVPESRVELDSVGSGSEGTYFRFVQSGESVRESAPGLVAIPIFRSTEETGQEQTLYIRLSGTASPSDLDSITLNGQNVPIASDMLSVTFPVGVSNLVLYVDVLDDDVHEPNKRLTFSIERELSGAESAKAYSYFNLYIEDDDPAPKPFFASASSSVTEGDSKNVTLMLSNPSYQETKALVKISGGNAASTDHDFTERFVTFPAGVASANIAISSVNDGLDELDETLELEVSPSTGLDWPSSDNKHTLTILGSDDSPTLSFDATSASVAEGSDIDIQLNLSVALDKDIYLPVSFSGSAYYGSDYKTNEQRFHIPAGETSATLKLNALSDQVYEGPEVASLSFEDHADAIAGADSVMDITITDAEATPQVSFQSSSYLAQEGSIIHLPIALSTKSSDDIVVEFEIEGTSSATQGSDYILAYEQEFIIPARTNIFRFPIRVLDDNLFEALETLTLKLTSASFENLDLPAPGLGLDETTINIRDGVEMARLSFESAHQQVSEGDASVSLNVKLDRPAGVDIDFSMNVSGEAKAGVNYNSFPLNHTIPAGSSSYTFDIDLIDDDKRGITQKLILSLLRPPKAMLGTAPSHEISIVDNDVKSSVTGFASNLAVANEGEQAYFEITLDRPAAVDIEVPATFGSTATFDEDYSVSSSAFLVPAGETSARIYIDTVNDGVYEGPAREEVRGYIYSGPHHNIGAIANASLEISDMQAVPKLSWSGASSFISRSEGSIVQLQVELDGPTNKDIIIDVLADDGYDTGDCNAACATVVSQTDGENPLDTDLHTRLDSGVLELIIPAGDTTASFSFFLYDQDHVEPDDERFRLTIQNIADQEDAVTDAAVIDTDKDRTEISIRKSGAGTVSLERSSTGILEGQLAYFTARLSAPAAGAITIPVTFSGSALEGEDFIASAQEFNIPAGASSGKISIFAINDNLYEGGPESARINLSPGAGYSLADSGGSIQINDAQTRPKLSWSSNSDNAVALRGSSVELSVELETPTYRDVVVYMAIEDSYDGGTCGQACANVLSAPYDTDLDTHPDFTGGGILTVTIPKGERSSAFSFNIREDGIAEAPDERFRLSIFDIDDSMAAQIDLEDNVFETSIIEPVAGDSVATINNSTAVVGEGELAYFEITLDKPSASDITIPASFSGLATQNEDYLSSNLPIIIPAGNISKRVYIYALDDQTYDENSFEDLEIELNPGVGYTLARQNSSMKIKDAQTEPPKVYWPEFQQFSGAAEGTNSYELALHLEYPTFEDVIVRIAIDQNYGSNCGTSRCARILNSPSDYDTNINTMVSADGYLDVTIPKGETQATFNFDVLNDADPNSQTRNFKFAIQQLASAQNSASIDAANNEQEFTVYENNTDSAAPSLAFVRAVPGSVLENEAAGYFEVVLGNNHDNAISIPVLFSYTATEGVDYTLPNDTSFEIPNDGSTTGRIDISTLHDGIFEGMAPEQIRIELQPAPDVVITAASAVMNIEDAQAKPKVSWLGDEEMYRIFDDGSAELRFELDSPLTQNLDVEIAIEDRYAENCNSACADILTGDPDTNLPPAESIFITIPAGDRVGALNFNVLDNVAGDALEERFRLIIKSTSRPELADIDPNDNEIEVAIIEADPAENLVTIAPTDFVVVEGGVSYFEITLDKPALASIDIPFTFSGSATEGVDYTSDASPVNIPAGATSVQIAINAITDGVYDGLLVNEQVQINLADTGGSDNYTLIQTSSIMEIEDLDPVPAP